MQPDAPASTDGASAEPYRIWLGDGWTGIAPPGRLDAAPLNWPQLPARYARAAPAWAQGALHCPTAVVAGHRARPLCLDHAADRVADNGQPGQVCDQPAIGPPSRRRSPFAAGAHAPVAPRSPITRRWGSDLAAAFCVASSQRVSLGRGRGREAHHDSQLRAPTSRGLAGEQCASLTRLELPVAVKALAGVWLCVAQLDAKRVTPVHVHVLD